MINRDFIKTIIKGRASKRIYTIYLLILMSFFATSLLISIIVFPLPFSFGDTWISELGDPTKNYPIGYVLFDVGFILTSLGLIPVFINFYYRLNSFHQVIRYILLGFWVIGTIFFGSIGILHDKMQPIHDIFSGIAFASLSIGFLFLLVVYVTSAIIRKSSKSVLVISLSIGQLALFWILLFAIPVRNNIEFGDFAPWEWVGTVSIILAIYLCSVILPCDEYNKEIWADKTKDIGRKRILRSESQKKPDTIDNNA